ncbi:MAG: nickel-dependent lactate racemase [Pyrinomonadaceae bacterium]
MPTIDLRYGSTSIPFAFDGDKLQIIDSADRSQPLSDIEIGEKFDSPIDSEPLENIVKQGETVLFVVPDATRRSGAGQIVNLLVRRLIANGTAPHEMAVIFATGIHRRVTDQEKHEILTPFIAQRIKTIDHDARDLMQIMRVGETEGGIPIELNRVLFEFDHIVIIGSVSFHYFAGFTGGRKLVCPGLASSGTISATHKLAFDCEKMDRRDGVGTGLLDGNAVHEVFVEAASKAKISFAVSTLVNDDGDVTDVFCGDWITSHRAACESFALSNTVKISEKRDLVIASCGGYPHDINLIQAHKSLEAASRACSDSGTIILLAECRDGLGRADFLNWFEAANSEELAKRLCEKYQVNGQTAWSLLKKAERFRIKLVSTLSTEWVEKMRMNKTELTECRETGYLIPCGSKLRICC